MIAFVGPLAVSVGLGELEWRLRAQPRQIFYFSLRPELTRPAGASF